jgi:hypothetical protein
MFMVRRQPAAGAHSQTLCRVMQNHFIAYLISCARPALIHAACCLGALAALAPLSGCGTNANATDPPAVVVAPALTLSSTPATVSAGQSSMLNWTAAAAVSCLASGGWSGTVASDGSQSTGPLNENTTYNLSCSGPGGSSSRSITVLVTTAPPTVTLTAVPSSIGIGGSTSLTWNSTNANFCTAGGGWSGTLGTSGSQGTAALTVTTDFDLTCFGAGGSTTQTATVTVASLAPVISLNAQPATVPSGGVSTLSWTTGNATSCSGSGGWAGPMATSGSQSTGALTATQTYVLTCSGLGGSATQSVTVSVSAATAPTVNLSASPSTVANGGSSTISWTSTNAVSCIASGGWSGSQGASGSFPTGTLTTTTTYTLTCTNATGSAAQSTTVTVSAPTPTVQLTANPTSVTSGNTSTLSWSSTNATSCAASGGWSGTDGTSGSQVTVALLATTKFTLTCTGPGGSAAQSTIVTVTAAPPTISGTPPATVAAGSQYTFSPVSTAPTGATLTFTVTDLPSWATFNTTTGQLSGTPTANNVGPYDGIVITVSDGTQSASLAAFTITVTSATADGTAILSWTAPTEYTDGTVMTDLSGYHVYYGTSATSLDNSIAITDPTTSTYTVTGLTTGTWYFAVAADSADGEESAQTVPLSKTI